MKQSMFLAMFGIAILAGLVSVGSMTKAAAQAAPTPTLPAPTPTPAGAPM